LLPYSTFIIFLFSSQIKSDHRNLNIKQHLHPQRQRFEITSTTMCIRIIEKYAVCGCIYHIHGVDACAAYGQHAVADKVISVGYTCPMHAK
jgi:hypothetical protein